MKSDKVLKGQVYFCPVCGAEASVIKAGNGNLAPVCCNTKMILKAVLNPVYYCGVCRSEVMVICGNEDNLEPKCCNNSLLKAFHPYGLPAG